MELAQYLPPGQPTRCTNSTAATGGRRQGGREGGGGEGNNGRVAGGVEAVAAEARTRVDHVGQLDRRRPAVAHLRTRQRRVGVAAEKEISRPGSCRHRQCEGREGKIGVSPGGLQTLGRGARGRHEGTLDRVIVVGLVGDGDHWEKAGAELVPRCAGLCSVSRFFVCHYDRRWNCKSCEYHEIKKG